MQGTDPGDLWYQPCIDSSHGGLTGPTCPLQVTHKQLPICRNNILYCLSLHLSSSTCQSVFLILLRALTESRSDFFYMSKIKSSMGQVYFTDMTKFKMIDWNALYFTLQQSSVGTSHVNCESLWREILAISVTDVVLARETKRFFIRTENVATLQPVVEESADPTKNHWTCDTNMWTFS